MLAEAQSPSVLTSVLDIWALKCLENIFVSASALLCTCTNLKVRLFSSNSFSVPPSLLSSSLNCVDIIVTILYNASRENSCYGYNIIG